MTLLSTEVDQ